uniref:Uncharacterized protein n=1 Tax=Meloidogyne incognita TaxID=6306 RepID=A0A914M2Z8_MELIC
MLVGLHPYEFIEPESGIFEFTLVDQLKNKWQAAIDKSIPLFLHYFEPDREVICIAIVNGICNSILKLPNIPKNINEMIIIRCWLEKLFNCAFGYASFYKSIFNPEMINILFDNDKTIPLQIGLKRALLWTNNKIFENALKFSLNHLSISESLSIDLDATSEQYTDILFNTLINEGNKFPKISLKFPAINLYNLIVKVSFWVIMYNWGDTLKFIFLLKIDCRLV